MSKQFKVGQKVRVTGVVNTRQACGSHEFDVGEERKVTQFDSSDNTYRLADEGTESWVHADDLEDVAPEFDVSKLKRGDKIQLKEGSVSKYGWKYNGKVAEVDYVYDDGDLTFDFEEVSGKIFQHSDILGYWPEDTPEYSVRDLVEVVDPKTGTYTGFKVGDIGEVTEINVGIGGKKLLVTVAGFPQLINLSQVKPFKRPKTKFKEFQVGDEVVVLGNKHTHTDERDPHKFEVGQVGTVVRRVKYLKGVLVSCGDVGWTVAHKDLHKLQPAEPVVEEPEGTTKHKYSVGDTLEVVSKTQQHFFHAVGEKVIVKGLKDDYDGTPGLNYRVEGGQVIHEDDLGPVTEPEPEYKKGDWVKVTQISAESISVLGTPKLEVGKVYRIEKAEGSNPNSVYLEDKGRYATWILKQDLEPAEEPKPEVKPVTLEDLEVGKEFMLTEDRGLNITAGVKVMILPEPYGHSMSSVPRVLQLLNGSQDYGQAVVTCAKIRRLQHLVD